MRASRGARSLAERPLPHALPNGHQDPIRSRLRAAFGRDEIFAGQLDHRGDVRDANDNAGHRGFVPGGPIDFVGEVGWIVGPTTGADGVDYDLGRLVVDDRLRADEFLYLVREFLFVLAEPDHDLALPRQVERFARNDYRLAFCQLDQILSGYAEPDERAALAGV